MKVFADLHHGDLYHSLRMLFEQRLGWTLYRPIGLDWHEKGFWKYNDNMPTVNQYLKPPDNMVSGPAYNIIPDPVHGEQDHCLTFEQFCDTDIDIVIASVRQHEDCYYRLIKEHKPKAKLIRQLANIHDVFDPKICRNLLASVEPFAVPDDSVVVFYHQEFDIKLFEYKPPRPSINYKGGRLCNSYKIKNFMNCLPDSRDFQLWGKYKQKLQNFKWKMHGILGHDGIVGGIQNVAKSMKATTYIWHVKYGGDGFGHVIHNAFALGRPIITRGSYYDQELAGRLIEDKKTCIDLDKRNFEENLKVINEFAVPDKHQKMCERAHERFCEVVDYDKEFESIKQFLAELV